MRLTLTNALIRKRMRQYDGDRVSLSDIKVPGLSVEVRHNTATFYLRASHQKRTTRVTLGKFPTLSVADARKLGTAHKRQFVLQVHEGVLHTSVDIRFDAYYEQHFLPWCKIYRRTYSSHQSMYKTHLRDRFGSFILRDLSSRDIFDLVNDLNAKGYSRGFINKTVQHIRSALKRAEELCGSSAHPSVLKPFTLLGTAQTKERFLDTAEAARLRDYVEAHDNDPVCLLIGFLMYTGARRHEAFNAEWQHINLERRSWYVPLTKNGKPRYIVLNDRALSIIERAKSLQERQYQHSQRWLFLNHRTLKPFRCIFYRWNKIRNEMGLSDMRLHDLRHSYASTLVNNGATLYEVQKLLGHARSATTERYAHLANHRLQQAASLIDKAYE